MFFGSSVDFFYLFFKKKISGIPSVSNSLDQDQARRFVRPDLDPNCLQRLSADDKSPIAGKELNTTSKIQNYFFTKDWIRVGSNKWIG